MLLANPATAALLSIAQYPLFLTHRTLPNVLVIYDNSESMDGTMAGKLIAGDDPTTRGNIARSRDPQHRLRNFSGQFNWGLESFGIGGAGLYSTYPYWLGNDTDDGLHRRLRGRISASNNGLRCIANPQWAGCAGDRYVTYDRASDDPDINDVLYIGYFGSGAWAVATAGGGETTRSTSHTTRARIRSQHGQLLDIARLHADRCRIHSVQPADLAPTLRVSCVGLLRGRQRAGSDQRADPPSSARDACANIQTIAGNRNDVRVGYQECGSVHAVRRQHAHRESILQRRLVAHHACRARRASSCSRPTATRPPTSEGNMYPLDQQVNTYNAVNGSWTFSRAANDVFGQISRCATSTVGGSAHDMQTYVVGMGDTVANPSSVAAHEPVREPRRHRQRVSRAGQRHRSPPHSRRSRSTSSRRPRPRRRCRSTPARGARAPTSIRRASTAATGPDN